MGKMSALERIDELRKDIDKIDEEIVALFERRMDTARAIGCIKRENHIAIKNESREEQVKANCRANCKNSLYTAGAEAVMMGIINECRNIQQTDTPRDEAPSEA